MEELKSYRFNLRDMCLKYLIYNPQILTELPHRGICLPRSIAHDLIPGLCEKRNFNASLLPILNQKCLDLDALELFGIEDCNFIDFSFLSNFNIFRLTLSMVKSQTLMNILSCLNQETRNSLEELSIVDYLPEDFLGFRMEHLLNYPRLTYLDISGTNLTDNLMTFICLSLPNLEFLNISKTDVTHIQHLPSLRRLTRFHMYSPENKCNIQNSIKYINSLPNLTELDISTDPGRVTCEDIDEEALNVFLNAETHPNLDSLNVSGLGQMFTQDILEFYIKNHPKISALLCTFMNGDKLDENYAGLIWKYPNLYTICNTPARLAILLQCFSDRPRYAFSALTTISSKLPSTFFALSNIPTLRAVLKMVNNIYLKIAIKTIPNLGENFYARICSLLLISIKKLIKNNYEILPKKLLNKAINSMIVLLEASTTDHQKKFKYLNFISSDQILFRTNLDEKVCYKALFKLLKYNLPDNEEFKQPVLCILSKLTQNMNFLYENSLSEDIKCLLTIICGDFIAVKWNGEIIYNNKSDMEAFYADEHYLLRYSLGVLWNMSDVNSQACISFVLNQGIKVYKGIIGTFLNCPILRNTIQAKCFGLLCNVVQIPNLRTSVLNDSQLVHMLWNLLHGPDLNFISEYFIAGIFCQLLCEPQSAWINSTGVTKTMYAEKLRERLLSWRRASLASKELFVNYRSFKPFEHLVDHKECPEVGCLWTLMSLYHNYTRHGSHILAKLDECPRLIQFIDMKRRGYGSGRQKKFAELLWDPYVKYKEVKQFNNFLNCDNNSVWQNQETFRQCCS